MDMTTKEMPPPRSWPGPWFTAFPVSLLYALLAVVFLRPLFASPGATTFNPPGVGLPDINLTVWILAWDWHALTTAPSELFDAGIFHPAEGMLAGSEHMLGHLLLFGPMYGVTGNAVLAYQLNLLLCFALSGTTLFVLCRHWRLGLAPSFVAGAVYVFSSIRTDRLGAMHLLAGQYLPIAILFFDRTLRTRRFRDALGLVLALSLQMLCSFYLAYFTVFAMGAYGATVVLFSWRHLSARGLALTVGAAILAAVPIALISLPYLAHRHSGVIPDYGSDARLKLFVGSVFEAYIHPPWSTTDPYIPGEGKSLYVGLVAGLLAAVALLTQGSRKDTKQRNAVWGALAITATCYVMAFGVELAAGGFTIPMPYRLAVDLLPGFSSMRVPSRFSLFLLAGLAMLVGFGWEWFYQILPTRLREILSAILVLAIVADFGLLWRSIPVRVVDTGATSPVGRALIDVPRGPLLELPVGGNEDPAGLVRDSGYMVSGTSHWLPLLNGFTGYRPDSAIEVYSVARALPDPRALHLLQRMTGVRYFSVHLSDLPPTRRARWENPTGLRLVRRDADHALFDAGESPSPDLRAALQRQRRTAPTTLLDVPLSAIPEEQRHAEMRLVVEVPERAYAGWPFEVQVEVSNRSAVAWPAMSSDEGRVVTMNYLWISSEGKLVAGRSNRDLSSYRLPYDLRPGESVQASFTVVAPETAGKMRLSLLLTQGAGRFTGALGPFEIDVGRSLVGLGGHSDSRTEVGYGAAVAPPHSIFLGS